MKKLLWLCLISTITNGLHQQLAEKPIVVLICSYNNAEQCLHALNSVLSQNYENWTAYFFDDASSKHDADYAQKFLAHYDPAKKIKVLRNTTRRGALSNQWLGQNNQEILNDAIIVFVDGDDKLAHANVFKQLNEEYHKGAVATFGQYIMWPSHELGHCREIPPPIVAANSWRDVPLPLSTSHLRTCYAGLIRQIPLQDLLYQGKFFPVSGDIAIFWPVLEMAGHRAKFISDILYIYRETEINDYKQNLPLVLSCYNDLKERKRYSPLTDQQLDTLLKAPSTRIRKPVI